MCAACLKLRQLATKDNYQALRDTSAFVALSVPRKTTSMDPALGGSYWKLRCHVMVLCRNIFWGNSQENWCAAGVPSLAERVAPPHRPRPGLSPPSVVDRHRLGFAVIVFAALVAKCSYFVSSNGRADLLYIAFRSQISSRRVYSRVARQYASSRMVGRCGVATHEFHRRSELIYPWSQVQSS